MDECDMFFFLLLESTVQFFNRPPKVIRTTQQAAKHVIKLNAHRDATRPDIYVLDSSDHANRSRYTSLQYPRFCIVVIWIMPNIVITRQYVDVDLIEYRNCTNGNWYMVRNMNVVQVLTGKCNLSMSSSIRARSVGIMSLPINKWVSSKSWMTNFLPNAFVSSRCNRNCFMAGSLKQCNTHNG